MSKRLTNIKRYPLIILISILFYHGVVSSEDGSTDEDREIIEILDILENYDFLTSVELYMNMNEIENFQNSPSIKEEKEEDQK